MTRVRSELIITTTAVMIAVAVTNLQGADWPAYRHDLRRSGVTQEVLSMPLQERWTYQSAHEPTPAWPEPGRELNRQAFDRAQEVTAADGLVFFGSSTDHKVYAIDLASGQPKWSFFTEGPVRFAPTVHGEQVFVASDDGWLYCLNAADGKLLWRFHGGPRDERMIGNGQLISRWPLRSGVAIDQGTVYFSAGMWPNEGVFLFAMNAQSGELLWKNDTTGIGYMNQPHPPACAITGVAPQGYLLGQDEQLFLPTGRSVPAVYDRDTGRLEYYRSRPNTWGDRWGGSWGTLAGDLMLTWRTHIGPDIDVQQGEYAPDPNDGIVAFDMKTGAVKRDFPGKLLAVVQGDSLFMSGGGKVTAYDFKKWSDGAKSKSCTKWETAHGRAYAMIVAADTVIVGGQETVTAIDSVTGTVLWSDKTDGQVRSLAVADSKLLVSTTSGQIKCYGQKTTADAVHTSFQPDAAHFLGDGADKSSAALVRKVLSQTGKRVGFCLVLGLDEGQLLYELATQSELMVYCIDPDADKVDKARRDLDRAGLYGKRIAIHHGSLEQIEYPDYFADLVLMADTTSVQLGRQTASDVFRVLHPYGGAIYCAAIDTAAKARVNEWIETVNMPETDVRTIADAVQVVRGDLPGAGNWTHQYASAEKSGCSTDQLARVPLRLLWFGEPGPESLISRHWKGPAPLCVDGRMYVVGQHCLIAVDAYNGRQLWRRDLPKLGRFPVSSTGSNVAADDRYVYVVMNEKCLRLDGETGETLHTYEMPKLSDSAADNSAKPLTWSYLAVNQNGILGGIGSTQRGQVLFLLDQSGETLWTYRADGIVGNNAITMDDQRVYLISQTPSEMIESARKRGEKLSVTWKIVALDATNGKVVWESEKGTAGRTHLWMGDGLLLATGGNSMCGYDAPTGKQLYARNVAIRRSPVITGNTIYGEPAAFNLTTGEPIQHSNPFTGTQTNWNFSRSYGCGAISGSPNLLLFRSGTLGMSDIAGDTGIHNFGGVRAGCYVNAIAAAGLVLMPTSDAGCTCSYCYQTTIALVPAHKQENWSVFFDRLPNTAVRQAALNLGAPGDQRDADGTLWIASPRPQTTGGRRDIAVPFRIDTPPDGGTFRVNADLTAINGTDRPWVYTSGVKGPVRAELDLEIFGRGITAWPAENAVSVDGVEREVCWDGYKAVPAGKNGELVTLRYDEQNLYLGFERRSRHPEQGKATTWNAGASGEDAPVWDDDSFEVYLSNIPNGRDVPSAKYLHLGVSASGARYDGLWEYVTPALPDCKIPRLDITVDGDRQDWLERGLRVESLPGAGGLACGMEDLDPSFQIGWNEQGVLLLVRVKDSHVQSADVGAPLEHGDSVEIWVTPQRGTSDQKGESYRLVVSPDNAAKSTRFRSRFDDFRKQSKHADLDAQISSVRTKDGYEMEICLPWKNLGLTSELGASLGMQLFVNDSDKKGEKPQFQARWHPAGNPQTDPLAFQTFVLAAEPSAPVKFERNKKRDSNGLYRVAAPPHFPLNMPPLGAEGEDTRFSGTWTSGVTADASRFVAEMAVPWSMLADAGFNKDQLMIYFGHRGHLSRPPVMGKGFERVIVVPAERSQPRAFSVRLHFVELEAVEPGQRLFDVKLQDRVVLRDFDIIAAAGKRNQAVVRQFDQVRASRAIRVELVPKTAELTELTTPTLCGIEILPQP